MVRVTATSSPLAAFDGLLDLERSRAFHDGRRAVDLATMRALVAALPPLPPPALALHVAGSEGKTGTTERLAAGLSAAGLRAATYTSPHLKDARERLRIGGAFPPDAALADAVETVAATFPRLPAPPSWFEALTATARVLFARAGVDAVVWETGLGGRLDATVTMPADLCVITSISLEHTAVLGADLATIAREKAGILRPGAPVVVAASVPAEAQVVIAARAAELGCELVLADTGSPADGGAHATALALAALDWLAAHDRLGGGGGGGRLEVTAAVREAVRRHRVAGRHEQHGALLFDGAHSTSACRLLAERLAGQRFGALVFAATSGRDPLAMLAPLLPLAEHVVLPSLPGPRAGDPQALARAAADLAARHGVGLEVAADSQAALARARQLAAGRRILVTGSLYLVGLLLPDGSPAC